MVAITVIGSLNYDLVTYTSVVPRGGETIHAKSFETHYGGKGLNEAVAVGKLLSPEQKNNIQVKMIGRVGNDLFGKEMKDYVSSVGVDVENVLVDDAERSGTAVILVEDSGENRILVIPGSNGKLEVTEKILKEVIGSNKNQFFILQNEQPDPVKHLELIRKIEPEATVVYNPSPIKDFNTENTDVLGAVDVLVVNESEALDCAKAFSTEAREGNIGEERSKFVKLAKDLKGFLNQSKLSTVIITLGGEGSLVVSDAFPEGQHFPAMELSKKQIIDTTGAGDTFLGAVTVRLANGDSIDQAVVFATAAASLTVQGKGAAEAIPGYEQVSKLVSS
ncbi:unnamed protein product [Kuraishia capsulata CBS 1993]|uniref:Ribokinase n=1 Tax=Kuraishia capsulata CBS 1993 TaxID=1382522 RepID=W6MNZ3_9ASCO|nr:uncharacterized protein KUCA_T00002756001 [Kuraishia capsulata CBS 1993]CDK26782.1 unnamed protein product [Kuraishia capsulata CBS 1993]